MGAVQPISGKDAVRFDTRWAQLTETANELFTAERFDQATVHYRRALDEAETLFEAAVTVGKHADDVVPMLLVSAANAARNHVMTHDRRMAFAQLERAALACLSALGRLDVPNGLTRAIVAHLPRLFIELDARELATETSKKRARELQSRLKSASLKAIKRAAN